MYRIGVISDTHGRLPAQVFEIFKGVDLILHAGDVGEDRLLAELETLAPVLAVSGNVDGPPHARLRPLERQFETPLGRVAMTHGHLADAPSTDLPLMARHFSAFGPSVIVYGHSHIAKLDEMNGVKIFNPGSAGAPRFGRPASVGLISGEPGGPLSLDWDFLDPR